MAAPNEATSGRGAQAPRFPPTKATMTELQATQIINLLTTLCGIGRVSLVALLLGVGLVIGGIYWKGRLG